ncbi:MAG: LamG domain-containing protein, partial [Myxococcales bacterium]|nr:LamG domain-containing protein [Myxococcales bacterium]
MSARRIYYAVLDLDAGPESDEGAEFDHISWPSSPKLLEFPAELAQLGFEAVPPFELPSVDLNDDPRGKRDPFMSTTARLGADVPFAVVSDNEHVYLFRQSVAAGDPTNLSVGNQARVDSTLLCDRFLLIGDELHTPRQVRFRRSRRQATPDSNADSLGASDMNERPFQEPTLELDFVRGLHEGRFAVLLLPTATPDITRWQFFVDNHDTGRMDSINLERGSDGLFNPLGSRFYTSPDPAFRDAVFESRPGTCPFTDRPLIPVVSPSVYAESALRFDDQGWVEVDGGPMLEQSFSIEAWVRVERKDANDDSDQTLVAQTLSDVDDETVFAMVVRGHGSAEVGRLAFGGTARGTVTGATVIDDGRWHHVAGVFDAGDRSLSLYVDGEPELTSFGALEAYPAPSTPLRIGALMANDLRSLAGDVDELRLWSRARTSAEIGQTMSVRLGGDELGLAAYWRFDEASGVEVFDQTANAHHGGFAGGAPTWIPSNAPVGDQPGLRRTSFGFAGKETVAGPAASLYHQQASSPGNEDGPIKASARVMLAVPVRDQGSSSDAEIASVDFAVSREGRLVQIPDQIELGTPLESDTNAQLAAIAQMKAEIAGLEAVLADDAHSFGPGPGHPFGWAMAVHNGWVVAGSSTGDRVHLFEYVDYQWQARQQLPRELSPGYERRWFGYEVAIDDDWVVVAALGSTSELGHVYVYPRGADGLITGPAQLLVSANGQVGDGFGKSVAINNGCIIVGSPIDRTDPQRRGRVSVFELDDNDSWVFVESLVGKEGTEYGTFGSSIALTSNEGGDWAVIGAENPSTTRRVYVLRRDANGSFVEFRVWRPGSDLGNDIGVAMRGNYLVMGRQKAVLTFFWDGTAWVMTGRHLAQDLSLGMLRRVALGASTLAIQGLNGLSGTKQNVLMFEGRQDFAQLELLHSQVDHYMSMSPVALHEHWGLIGFPLSSNGLVKMVNLGVLDRELARRKAEIETAETNLTQAAVALNLAHVDPMGLTLCAGLLGFAPCEGTPSLTPTVDGQLGLYFRGSDEVFAVAYFDNSVVHGTHTLAEGKLELRVRAPLPERDQVAVTIFAGDASDTCEVVIDDPIGGLREHWREVPRRADRFAAVLGGELREPVWVSSLGIDHSATITSLSLGAGLGRSLALGSVLEIDNQRVVISEHVARGATTIPVTAMTLEKILASGASVRWLPYDYAGRAKVHNLRYALVGELASTHEQSISSLSLAEGALVDVDAGSCLIVDGVRLLVNADASVNATSLSLDSISLPHSLGERAKVYAVTAAHGPETQSLSHDLRHGSLHARARASGQGAAVADGAAARTLRSLPCRWVAN